MALWPNSAVDALSAAIEAQQAVADTNVARSEAAPGLIAWNRCCWTAGGPSDAPALRGDFQRLLRCALNWTSVKEPAAPYVGRIWQRRLAQFIFWLGLAILPH